MICFCFVLLASLCASGSSLAFSQTVRRGGSSGGYLVNYFLICFLVAFFLNGIPFSAPHFSLPMSLVGAGVGVLIAALMFSLGRALQKGPSGMTFAFQNCGAVVPPLLLAVIFSKPFGFSLSWGNLVGMALVVTALVYASLGSSKSSTTQKSWILYALGAFVAQGLILSIFQWRCLLWEKGVPDHSLIPFFCTPEADLWFMPALFLCAWIYQALTFFYRERRLPNLVECVGGGLGGVANGLSTFFILKATSLATDTEKMMLFPIFTVTIILLCNLFGKFFYQEKISWKANALAVAGIVIGTAF